VLNYLIKSRALARDIVASNALAAVTPGYKTSQPKVSDAASSHELVIENVRRPICDPL
jgi:hypothetical protein